MSKQWIPLDPFANIHTKLLLNFMVFMVYEI